MLGGVAVDWVRSLAGLLFEVLSGNADYSDIGGWQHSTPEA